MRILQRQTTLNVDHGKSREAHENNRRLSPFLKMNRLIDFFRNPLRGFERSLMLLILAMTLCVNAWAEEFIVGACTHFDNGVNEAVKSVDLLQAAGMTSFR